MGCCLSKSKEKDDREGRKKRTRNKNKNGFENDRSGNAKKAAVNGKKSRSKRYTSSSEESSSESDVDHRKPKVSSTKKTKRGKDGSITVISTKTIVGGDQITIGERATNVNVTIGDRNRRRSGERRDKPKAPKASTPNLWTPDFSKLKPRHENGTFQMPHCFMQPTNRSKIVADMEVLVKAAKSVGKIHASNNFCATGFRVGPKYIMTCKHVLEGIIVKERNRVTDFACQEGSSKYDVLEKSSVYVDFNYNHPNAQSNNADIGNSKFFLKPVVKFENEVLDVAILELKETEGVPFPDAFINFSQALPNEKFTFLGHPQGKPKEHNEVDGPVNLDDETYQKLVEWSMRVDGSNGFVGVNMPERFLFHCSMQHGGSGSPGIAIEGGEKAVVVTMLLRGYPDWYYCNPQMHTQVAPTQCIEQGVDMVALYKKMHSEDRDLCNTIFGQNA